MYTHTVMGNKTIYFRDDKLWERAKKLAGDEGISAVIQNALAEFVERKTRERDGFRRVRIESGASDPDATYGKIDRAAFDGRKIASQRLSFEVPPGRDLEGEQFDADFIVYETKSHKLVLSVEPYYYNVYTSPRALS